VFQKGHPATRSTHDHEEIDWRLLGVVLVALAWLEGALRYIGVAGQGLGALGALVAPGAAGARAAGGRGR